MAQFRVGCVPYVNAVPLVWWFESLGDDSPVEVVYEVPSQLPQLMDAGEVQAILVSSVDALFTANRTIAEGVCIRSDGPVKSVRLFSKVEFGEIRTLALDQSSMTSNQLAQLVLRQVYGCSPSVVTLPPDPELMLKSADACILIGDIGMSASVTGANVMDLGEEWQHLTGLPFVWAAWTGRESIPLSLVDLLVYGYEQSLLPGGSLREEVIELGMQRCGWSADVVSNYLNDTIRYRLDARALDGLGQFGSRLIDCRLAAAMGGFPANIVKPSIAASLN